MEHIASEPRGSGLRDTTRHGAHTKLTSKEVGPAWPIFFRNHADKYTSGGAGTRVFRRQKG
ncbi:hypothetical protein DBV15_08154 [Temnothorax longispinosus]|uniref:Uncharacterized protein n=1 Tax=Temnothorax longispinosus TaxID=300112 RepID=A0A4S2L2C8_9HYME|nr:hypothetical protein DBV15_08154 [Temnothorax longispinosus]